MCGIVGQITFVDQNGVAQDEAIISRLNAFAARRGPDDEGFWSDGHCFSTAFRRLSVLDPSPAGHQPMLAQDGRYVIVYNGEVYNFPELRHELQQDGVRFRSTGDTEVVLYALACWGTGALSRFNGMFALGFYDTAEQRLLLARDHAGIKPLYYMLVPQGLVFASQYDQILVHPWSHDLRVSEAALSLYLRLGYIPAPYALLQKTHMLEPGTWMEVTKGGGMRGERFFEFPTYREPDLQGPEAYEAVDAAVTSAVRRQLVSDVPIGTFLSGGIDSPLVAAKMRAATDGTVRAFTIGTNGDSLDESTDAMAYAGEIGVEHFVEQATADISLQLLNDVVTACSEPFADYSIFPTLLVSRLAREQVKVMLSGDGGDELFWGYADRLSSVLGKLPARLNGVGSAERKSKKWFDPGIGMHNPPGPENIGHAYRLKHRQIPEDWLNRIFPDFAGWPDDFAVFTYIGTEPTRTAQWLRWNEFVSHLTMVLLKVDRGSMYNSLEVRVPLLDRQVIEAATRVDWRSCLDLDQKIGKLPLRHSLARHVRHQTWTKRGFTVSMDSWLRGPLRNTFETVVLGRKDILGLPVCNKSLQRMFEQHLSMGVNHARGLWTILSLCLWEDRHFRARHQYSFLS
jgi:asparagine synthase (glutamine-hydrolysing)